MNRLWRIKRVMVTGVLAALVGLLLSVAVAPGVSAAAEVERH